MSDKPARDLTEGIPTDELRDGAIVQGRVGDDEVIVVARGSDVFAIGAHCTHYQGPLADGLIVGDTIRCPWHHACFDLRTGEALRAPALDPVPCWRVERRGNRFVVAERLETHPQTAPGDRRKDWPTSIVIVGGGAAGCAAAEMLRRRGYDGPVTMLSADTRPPPDWPNLSKDYLAAKAQADWIPLRSDDFYRDAHIDLILSTRVTDIDVRGRSVRLADNRSHPFGALLLATGAEPVRLPAPGADEAHVSYLRSLGDSDAIIAKAKASHRVVVVGASFIGLEVAASLRERGLDVSVVAPEARPMEKVLGPELGDWVHALHKTHGVQFHLGRQVARIDKTSVRLDDGSTLAADFVVVGIGVRPRIELAERAGLRCDHGVVVNELLETSVPGIFAAGDIARWPDTRSGKNIRVEHWVVAERQGQTAARNILGAQEKFVVPPFFWSQHYDASINYVGHAESWDRIAVDGKTTDGDCTVTYYSGERALAVATIGRDMASLQAEAAMEHDAES